jgi:hypothetical protein
MQINFVVYISDTFSSPLSEVSSGQFMKLHITRNFTAYTGSLLLAG